MPELIPPYYASLAGSGGTGDISIGARIPPHADLKGVVSYDDPLNPADKVIKYTIYHGKNMEWGTATVTTGGMLTGRTPAGKVENGTPDEASPTPLNITTGAFIHWRDPKQDAALAQLDQDVSTTASPSFQGLTLTTAGVLALAMLNSSAAVGLDISMDADAARLTANAATPLGLGANGTPDQLVLNVDGTITASGGGSLTGTWSDMGTVTTIDINGGTIDGTVIGGSVAAAGSFTTLNASGNATVEGNQVVLGTITTDNGGQSLTIKPGAFDHAYMAFNARTASPNTRSGYIGYSSAATTTMNFVNDLVGAQNFFTNGINWLSASSIGTATFSNSVLGGKGFQATGGSGVSTGGPVTFMDVNAGVHRVGAFDWGLSKYLDLSLNNGALVLGGTDNAFNSTFAGNLSVAGNISLTGNLVGDSNASSTIISGGIDPNVGANIIAYGPANPSNPGHFLFRDSTTNILQWLGTNWTFHGKDVAGVGNLTVGGDLNVAGMVNLGTPTTLTCSADAITVTKSNHRVSGQGAAADDLSTINGGSDGDIICLKCTSSTMAITVKHGVGNIYLNGSADFILASERDKLWLQYDGDLSEWHEIGRGDNG